MPIHKFALSILFTVVLLGFIAQPASASDSSPTQERAIALLKGAQGEVGARSPSEAMRIWRQIYSGAYPSDTRMRASLLIADQYAASDHPFLARLWMRRAFELAPDSQTRTAIALMGRRISSANPLSLSAQISVAPSNNVNNVGKTNIIMIGGLPFSFGGNARPLSGIDASAAFSATYRLGQSPTFLTEAFADASIRKVWLDSDAAEIAPDVGSTDFDQLGLSLGLRHSWQLTPGLGPTLASLSFGTGLIAGEPVSQWRSIELQQEVLQSKTNSLRFNLGLRADDRLDTMINSSVSRRIGSTFQHKLDSGMSISLRLLGSEIRSESALVDRSQIGAGISIGGIKIGPFDTSVSLEGTYADYPKWILTPGGRQDISVDARIEAAYGAISVLGFSPLLTLRTLQTDSNLDIFDRSQTSLGLSFRSNF
jgi:hypothetical protein